MRIAVISDIHGNLHALEAVLAAIERERPDAIWCLGDVVGYGPRPNECCTAVRERAALCLIGNHDLAVLGGLSLLDFAPDAAVSAEWTRGVLDEASESFLRGLAPRASLPELDVELVHGSPRDPVWEYVLTAEAALAALAAVDADLLLVGHSHVALGVRLADGAAAGGLTPDGTTAELSGTRWLVNPGSVGQPRDGDPRAAFALIDLQRGFAKWQRVAYSVEATQSELRALGLPEALAARLAVGA
jgi:predicted phosphodiesterase